MIKPRGYWTKDNCLVEAKKFLTRKEWQISSGSSYQIARRNNWLDECCEHMQVLQKSWSLSEIIASAQRFSSRSEWIKSDSTSYSYARSHGWIDDASSHMVSLKLRNGTWSKEACIFEAKKYSSKLDWKNHSPSSYVISVRNKWMYECSAHFLVLRKHEGYTKDELIEDAKKYQTRNEWRNSSSKRGPSPYYSAAQRYGLIDECCSHMSSIIKPKGYWTKKRCIDEAKLFLSIKEWHSNSSGSYQIARRNGWLSQATKHMHKLNISYGEYLIHKLLTSLDIGYQEEKSFPELRYKSTLFYDFFVEKLNLVIEFHGEQHYKFNKHWHNDESGFLESLKKDKVKDEFLRNNGVSLLVIPYTEMDNLEKLILNEFIKASKKLNVSINLIPRELSSSELKFISSMCQWTKELVFKDSLRFEYLKDWRDSSPSAYATAQKHGWLIEASSHLTRKIIPRSSWTKNLVMDEAKKYLTRSEWSSKHSRTYKAALRNGWDKDACMHMKNG